MRPRTLRVRLLLVCLAVLTLSQYIEKYYFRLPRFILELEPHCLNPVGPERFTVCGVIRTLTPGVWVGQWIFCLIALLVSFRWVARWTLAPARELIPVIEQVGPQNLGYRLRANNGRADEISLLGRALNTMMDRISAGYEGQRRFAANASHELRTPLALQRMLIEIGMSEPLTPEQSNLLTNQLLQANDRNERLLEGLLVLSQSDQGLAAHSPQRLDEIAATMIDTHQATANKLDVRLTAELRPRIVHGDQVLLERLVRNLLHNALKYNHPGGRVHINVGEKPALSIVNTGLPIPPEGIARLFEPFTRLSTDRLDHSGGSGLGLTIARSVVQAHRGTITAHPGTAGGLRVEVNLPTLP